MIVPSDKKTPKLSRRDPNLDLLRAIAILLVTGYHILFITPGVKPEVKNFGSIGKCGVDLFFVLSGWLVGGIYWREWRKEGSIQLLRFWKRRWMRTLPPYLAALFLSWIVVYIERREPFDVSFLLFLQNYYPTVPYFKASWSLCVEEHFYLVLPWFLMLFARKRGIGAWMVLAIFVTLPFVRMQYASQASLISVGYIESATHLRCEGLALGVLASGIAVLRPAKWGRITRICRWLAAPALLFILSSGFWSDSARYVVGYSVQAIGWTIILAAAESREPLPLAESRPVFWIASMAYSIYLTNVLALHAAEGVAHHFGFITSILLPLTATVIIAATGVAFYFIFERPAILLRERFVPNRDHYLSPLAEPITTVSATTDNAR